MIRIALAYFLFLPFLIFSQKKINFTWPIDSPRVITGNYGELRPNHFHTGIDFSTKGKVNLQVYAAGDGYISRIKVSSVGYGKCLYITHPNGKVTVYAHLNSFSLKIAEVVKNEQYKSQQFEVEILPKPGLITVKKKEIIGLSGNTGGSTGPHLHFEVRDEKSEVPLNPFSYFKIPDKTAPVLQRLAFFNLSDTCAPKFLSSFRIGQKNNDSLVPEKDSIIVEQSILGLAFSGFDRNLKSGNTNNIYSAKLFLDDRLIYSHRLDNIDFAANRYVNEFSAKIDRFKYQKCFLPTLYPDGFYGKCLNKGRLVLIDSNFHKINLVVNDESGNENRVQFYLKAKKQDDYRPSSIRSDVFVNCNEDLVLSKNNLQVFIPANTLYYSTPIIFENTIETTGKLIVLPSEINLRASCVIGFKVPDRLLRIKNKLILKSGTAVMTPVNTNDSVFFFIKNFGWFQLGIDTVGPKIRTSLPHRKLKKMKHVDSFSFVITDKTSGIVKYNLLLNNKWVLAEYDAKNDLLTYYFDEGTPKGTLQFHLEVEDKVGNKSQFEVKVKN